MMRLARNLSLGTSTVLLLFLATRALAQTPLTMQGAGVAHTAGGSCDPNFANVVLLIGNDSKANGTSTFTDQSPAAATVSTLRGSVTYDTSTAPTGLTSSIRFTNAAPGDGLLTSNSSNYDFAASQDWTVEFFIRSPNNSGAQHLIGNPTVLDLGMGSAGGSWDTILNGAADGFVAFAQQSGDNNLSAPTTNVWTHVAWYRFGGSNLYAAINGNTNLFNSALSLAFTSPNALSIGSYPGSISNGLVGNLAAIRVTKGVSRYGASNFTPPGLPLPHC